MHGFDINSEYSTDLNDRYSESLDGNFDLTYKYSSFNIAALLVVLNRPTLSDKTKKFLLSISTWVPNPLESFPTMDKWIPIRIRKSEIVSNRNEFICEAKKAIAGEKGLFELNEYFFDTIKRQNLSELKNDILSLVQKMEEKSDKSYPYIELLLVLHHFGFLLSQEQKELLYNLRWIGDPKEHLKKAGWLEGLKSTRTILDKR